jgi:hypothetical protein
LIDLTANFAGKHSVVRKRSPNHPKREATGEGELSHKNVETRCGQPESYGIRKLEISRPNATPGILAQELSSIKIVRKPLQNTDLQTRVDIEFFNVGSVR